ncbi:MAG: helix-turn-helix transcriptional regulator [Paludibacteraceae bacterium]|nr:helix-turn-helix transcriptional regulator [Paludibacteraceae bacterium]
MTDIYNYSTTEIVRMLGQRVRKYRILSGLTQKELAQRADVSVPTLQAFEKGQNKDISFSTLLRLLRGLGQLDRVEDILSDLWESPYMLRSDGEQVKRVRHSKS